jgi:hypothetical protein
MNLRRPLAVVASLVLLLKVPPAVAQPDSVPGSVNVARLGTLCWREVRAAPGCRAWIATEIAFEYPVAFTKGFDQRLREANGDGRLVMSVGPMVNHQPNAAVGALAAVNMWDGNGPFLQRVEGRYRRWIGRRTGIDVGVGFAQAWVPAGAGLDDIRARGITTGIGIEHHIIGVDARIDWLQGGGEPRRAALVGAHTSSYGSGIVYAVGTIVGMIGLIATTTR